LSATRIERSFLIADFIRFGWVIAKDRPEIRLKPYKRIFFLSGAPVRGVALVGDETLWNERKSARQPGLIGVV